MLPSSFSFFSSVGDKEQENKKDIVIKFNKPVLLFMSYVINKPVLLFTDLPTPLSDWKGHVLFAKGTNGTFFCPQKGHKRDIFRLSEGTKRVIFGIKQDFFVLRKNSFIFGTWTFFANFCLSYYTESQLQTNMQTSPNQQIFCRYHWNKYTLQTSIHIVVKLKSCKLTSFERKMKELIHISHAKNFRLPPKGGRKILDLVNFFSMFLKHNFFMFCGYFGHF